jgi:hypothetical protein
VVSMLGLLPADWLKARLWLLFTLPRSTLVLRFSMISPPAMTTGLRRSARKLSLLTRLSCDDKGSGARIKLPRLPLRLRIAPIRPYPSCPVPAAGPLRVSFLLSFFSALDGSSGFRFLRPKKGKREEDVDVTTGLGVRETGMLVLDDTLVSFGGEAALSEVAEVSLVSGRCEAEAFLSCPEGVAERGRELAGSDSLPRLSL